MLLTPLRAFPTKGCFHQVLHHDCGSFTVVLFLLVLTNDLHQHVFVFPADAAVWMNDYDGSLLLSEFAPQT